MIDYVHAELRLETIEQLMRRTEGEFAEDENTILELASFGTLEFCQMIEIDTKRRLGIIKGKVDMCPLNDYYELMLPEKQYINIHNHPDYSCHSMADLFLLLTKIEIDIIRVISADRTYVAKYSGIIEVSKEDFYGIGNLIYEELLKEEYEQNKSSFREVLYKRNLAIAEIYKINISEELVCL